ncbi:MAG: methyltransferase domain-containing protein [Planctomycetes bacterium]|nr:methyltransferase domain-containing protein [Planctomycetota bacterium]
MATPRIERGTEALHGPADLEAEVSRRYADGAIRQEAGLCCPSAGYDPKTLALLPEEIVDKDYGCGDPSRHVSPGEIVVDLGSGAGKVCYIVAQKVGATGKVVGLDFNNNMLALARKYQDEMGRKLGYRNVEFRKARIQDMKLDLEAAEAWLRRHPITCVDQIAAYDAHCEGLRRENPLIADETADAILSSCVLNLVRPEEKRKLFREMYRVLKRDGRAVISDIVCDRDPTPAMVNDPTLWSGCISGAFREDMFLQMFEDAGFHGVEILARAEHPWQVVDGIEFRSLTVRAFKGKEGPCVERNQEVVYRGPWKQVSDDDGHVLQRGRRTKVCEKTLHLLTDPGGPYAGHVLPVTARLSPAVSSPSGCVPGRGCC